ncbi:hypothetical protein GCM10027162_46490 [Streptomyces incanus]
MTATPTLAPDLCTHGLPAFRFTLQSDTSTDVAMLLRDVMPPLPMRDGWGEDMEWPSAGVPADVIAEFAAPCPTTFRRLDELGPEAVGQLKFSVTPGLCGSAPHPASEQLTRRGRVLRFGEPSVVAGERVDLCLAIVRMSCRAGA